jgi:hypothetical protein
VPALAKCTIDEEKEQYSLVIPTCDILLLLPTVAKWNVDEEKEQDSLVIPTSDILLLVA